MRNNTTDLPKIGEREMNALHEVARYHDRFYWWRQASMHKLERHGMVERMSSYDTKHPAWRITSKGLEECARAKAT